MARSVFITVADASGDQHAAEFVAALRQLDPQLTIEGIGGARMLAAGATLSHETVGRAAMGWRGALRAFEMAGILREIRAKYAVRKPDLHVCIDSSAMNLPFARMAHS